MSMTDRTREAATRSVPSRDVSHFDALYMASDDPWSFRTSSYERHKYEATLSALPRCRFASALEVGCSIGELTRLLATRCDHLVGIDIAEAPLATARTRCADLLHVDFHKMAVPEQFPNGPFDLIVLSEILYFLSFHDMCMVAAQVCDAARPGAVVMLVNFLGHSASGQGDDPQHGNMAADGFLSASIPHLQVDLQEIHDGFRIDRLLKAH